MDDRHTDGVKAGGASGAAPLDQEAVKAFFATDAYLQRNAIVRIRTEIVQDLAGPSSRPYVLDMGCGDGSISRPFIARGSALTLVDLSPEMLERARRDTPDGAEVTFVQSDVMSYEPDRSYELVLCIGVLAHVPSVEGAIARIAAATAPGGLCLIQLTDDSAPLGWLLNRYYRARPKNRWVNRMNRAAVLALADRFGLRPVAHRRYGLLLPGLGRLPAAWERRAEEAIANSKTLSRAGAELLIAFEKAPF